MFENIRSIRPAALYVAADGPRSEIAGETQRCKEVRRIATAVDWDCEVRTLFRENNLGCALGVSSAIGWFFQNVEEGIILEDDCVPSRSFYFFCQDLLNHYDKNPRIMHISGNNFQYGRKRGAASYYFSHYTHNWGWATWRRAWACYEFDIVPEGLRTGSWDLQWQVSVEKQGGTAILPNVNLVKNIGFGADATHTKDSGRFAFLTANEIEFPLAHPKEYSIDKAADEFTYYSHFRNVDNLRMIWFYKLGDYVIGRLKQAKRAIKALLVLLRNNSAKH